MVIFEPETLLDILKTVFQLTCHSPFSPCAGTKSVTIKTGKSCNAQKARRCAARYAASLDVPLEGVSNWMDVKALPVL